MDSPRLFVLVLLSSKVAGDKKKVSRVPLAAFVPASKHMAVDTYFHEGARGLADCLDLHKIAHLKGKFNPTDSPSQKYSDLLRTLWISGFFQKRTSPAMVDIPFLVELQQPQLKNCVLCAPMMISKVSGTRWTLNFRYSGLVDLHDVMMEAIQLDRVEFVSILLFHGCLISPSYT